MIILVANNPFGHHLLTSQMLDHYREMDIDADIILLCNGIIKGAAPLAAAPIQVISFASGLGGLFSHFNLLFHLLAMRLKHPHAAYHLRGFVSGFLFCLTRLCILGKARYIYDPRGAFFIEWREAGRPGLFSHIFRWVEARLVRNSVATIVTSDRFSRLYRRLFGKLDTYLTVYNSTSFAFVDRTEPLATEGPLRIVYLGTFNHWHDMEEIARVMACATQHFGPERTEIFIYTSPRFHDDARLIFGKIDCRRLSIEYVNYHDIPAALADKHIGVSVVRPSLSTRIASPIKVSDYVALDLIPLLNIGIGDFDEHFRAEGSAILYKFKEPLDLGDLKDLNTSANKKIFDLVSRENGTKRLAPTVKRLLEG